MFLYELFISSDLWQFSVLSDMTLLIDFVREVDSLKQYTRFQVKSKLSFLLLQKCHFHKLAKKNLGLTIR